MIFRKTNNLTLRTLTSLSFVLAVLLCGAQSGNAQVLRIGEADAKKATVRRTEPEFPAIARQMNLSGRVVVDLFIDVDGSVERVDTVSGSPILAASAVNAGKRWKFQPFLASGQPAKAVVRITFEFVR